MLGEIVLAEPRGFCAGVDRAIEIVERALALNAGAVVLAHNHPSGLAEPSRADELVTQAVKAALQLVDVRVLDHMVVGSGSVLSFAERGLI